MSTRDIEEFLSNGMDCRLTWIKKIKLFASFFPVEQMVAEELSKELFSKMKVEILKVAISNLCQLLVYETHGISYYLTGGEATKY